MLTINVPSTNPLLPSATNDYADFRPAFALLALASWAGNYFYKTFHVSIMSIIFLIIMLSFTIQSLIDLYTEKIVSISRDTEYFDPSGFSYNPALDGFTI